MRPAGRVRLVLAGMLCALAATGVCAEQASQQIAQANVALQAGEADRALAELKDLAVAGGGAGQEAAEAHNLTCRVRFALEQFDAAVTECEQAVKLAPEDSDFHLWLGRALGEKASRASFVSAYGLAKRTRAEFEEAVRLNPHNVEALADLGDFYSQAPGVVGGGVDKAEQIAGQLAKIDAARGHQLRAEIAGQQKDYASEERELKMAVSVDPHPALSWSSLASFYAKRKEFDEMDAAIKSAVAAANKDKHATVALYDSAGLLIESGRDAALAASLLESYLASASKTEEAPAFAAHLRLARLKAKAGDAAGARQERDAALGLAREYKAAMDFHAQLGNAGPAGEQVGL